MLGHRCPLEQRRVPCLRLPLLWVLEARAEPPSPRWEFSLKKRGRKRERDLTQGKPVFSVTGPSFIVLRKGLLYLFCTQRSMDNIKLCSVSSPDSYRDQAFSLHTQLYTQVLGDLHHLLARGPINILQPFSDKDNNVVLFKVWCHSQKALNKVTFLQSKDTTIYNKEREVQ